MARNRRLDQERPAQRSVLARNSVIEESDQMLNCSSYGFLWTKSLRETVDQLSRLEIAGVEVVNSPPHDVTESFRSAQRHRDLPVIGLNPPGLDINLTSPDPEWRAASVNHYIRTIQSAHACKAEYVVVVLGRRHPLWAAPVESAQSWAEDGLSTLAEVARDLGIKLAVENTPNSFFPKGAQISNLLNAVDHDSLSICYDIANGHFVEDAYESLRQLSNQISVVHLSDTGRDRWSHNPIGNGSVNWSLVGSELGLFSSKPKLVLETLHSTNPIRGLESDLSALRLAGIS